MRLVCPTDQAQWHRFCVWPRCRNASPHNGDCQLFMEYKTDGDMGNSQSPISARQSSLAKLRWSVRTRDASYVNVPTTVIVSTITFVNWAILVRLLLFQAINKFFFQSCSSCVASVAVLGRFDCSAHLWSTKNPRLPPLSCEGSRLPGSSQSSCRWDFKKCEIFILTGFFVN